MGVAGVLIRRATLLIVLDVRGAHAERRQPQPSPLPATAGSPAGQAFARPVMGLAAAEVAIGCLAVALYRNRYMIQVDHTNLLEGLRRRTTVPATIGPAFSHGAHALLAPG